MKIVKEIKKIWKGQTKAIDIWYYFQGMIRYRIYYNSKLQRSFLMRTHIKKQIDYRIIVMNQECYKQGSCIKCGCMTTALQMCDKPCEGWCYPSMMNKENWELYKRGYTITEEYDKSRKLYWVSDWDTVRLIEFTHNINKTITDNVQRP